MYYDSLTIDSTNKAVAKLPPSAEIIERTDKITEKQLEDNLKEIIKVKEAIQKNKKTEQPKSSPSRVAK